MTAAIRITDAFPDLVPIDGGWRVKTVPEHGVHIDVLLMIFNARVVTTPIDDPLFIDRGWCYLGNRLNSTLRAIAAATEWDGAPGTDPAGWYKAVHDGRLQPEHAHEEETR